MRCRLNPSANTFGNAHFVRITKYSDVTGTVLDTDDTQLGQFYLEDGDTIIIEKGTTDKIRRNFKNATVIVKGIIMTITTTKLVDDDFKIIVNSNGVGGEFQQN